MCVMFELLASVAILSTSYPTSPPSGLPSTLRFGSVRGSLVLSGSRAGPLVLAPPFYQWARTNKISVSTTRAGVFPARVEAVRPIGPITVTTKSFGRAIRRLFRFRSILRTIGPTTKRGSAGEISADFSISLNESRATTASELMGCQIRVFYRC